MEILSYGLPNKRSARSGSRWWSTALLDIEMSTALIPIAAGLSYALHWRCRRAGLARCSCTPLRGSGGGPFRASRREWPYRLRTQRDGTGGLGEGVVLAAFDPERLPAAIGWAVAGRSFVIRCPSDQPSGLAGRREARADGSGGKRDWPGRSGLARREGDARGERKVRNGSSVISPLERIRG